MNNLNKNITQAVGFFREVNPLTRDQLAMLPLYLKEGYTWHKADLNGNQWLLAECMPREEFSVTQLETHFKRITHILGIPVIALFDQLEAYNRKRLVEKGIAFIVNDKQVYIPNFLIDLKETKTTPPAKKMQLTPMGQVLVLYYLLDQKGFNELEDKAFKDLALFFHTQPMQITRMAENLRALNLIGENTGKEKNIRFNKQPKALWTEVKERNLLIDPVFKRVYTDRHNFNNLLYSNSSALAAYTDMNPTSQIFLAIDRKEYLKRQPNEKQEQVNPTDAAYCLEVWKYDPKLLVKFRSSPKDVVDPLSLYLSMRHDQDERVEMALDQLLKEALW